MNFTDERNPNFEIKMLIADSDLPPSISPPSPSTPNPIETLDESSIGVHAVQSLAISSPFRVPDGDQAAEEEVSLGPSFDDKTLTAPSSVNHVVECGDDVPRAPDEFDEPFSDICLSDNNYKRWTPNVSPGYGSDEESTSYWLNYNQPWGGFIQEPPKMIEEPSSVVCFLNSFYMVVVVYNMVSFNTDVTWVL